MKELDILGSRNALPEDFENVIRVLESGLYPAAQTVTRVVPFAQAGDVDENSGQLVSLSRLELRDYFSGVSRICLIARFFQPFVTGTMENCCSPARAIEIVPHFSTR